jgi:hypothetical protein
LGRSISARNVGGRNVKASSGLFCPFPTQGRAAVSSGSYLDHSDHLSNQGEASFWELYFHVLTMACAGNTVNAAAPESVCCTAFSEVCDGPIAVYLTAFTAVAMDIFQYIFQPLQRFAEDLLQFALQPLQQFAMDLLQYALQPLQQFAMDLLQYALQTLQQLQ